MSKDIEFIYIGEHAYNVVDRPQPASSFIPQWFKDLEQYHGGKLITRNQSTSSTAKKCIPLLDGMTTGYTLKLWTDINVVKLENGKREITWRTSLPVFDIHKNADTYLPSPPGYDSTVYKFIPHLRIKTPNGYSVLVIPPSGHNESIFRAIPAVVDTDGDVLDFTFPMWIQKDYYGIIERGIPMATVIPFKRESWKAKYSYVTNEQHAIDADNTFNKTIKNHYRNFIWKKKSFK